VATLVVRTLGLACAVLLVLASCESRPRNNPLDPQNPITGGGPASFRALAGNMQIELVWSAAPSNALLAGFRLERRRHGPNPFVEVTPVLPPTVTGYVDQTVTNDLEYDYRLSYILPDGGISGTPQELTSRPGPELVWVADPGADEVVRVSPDARARIHTITNVRGVNRVSVQLSGGEIWATEPPRGQTTVHDPSGALVDQFTGTGQPNALAVDPTSQTAWICDEQPGLERVRRFTQNGSVVGDAGLFGLASDVAIIPGGGAWIVDQEAGWVVKVNSAGTPLDTVVVGSDPRRLAVDTLDGSVWVTRFSAGEIVHFSSTGTILTRIPGLAGPYAVDIDEFRDQIWIGLDQANAVQVRTRADGTFKFLVQGISRPRGLAVVDRTGECWVTAIAAHELVQIGANGTIQVRNNVFAAPFDVRVDPGPR
jgi:streptogramin lyase